MVVGVYYFIKVQKKNKTHGIQSKVNCPELDGQKFLYKQQHFFYNFSFKMSQNSKMCPSITN